jgi:Zn-finger protein
MKHFKFFQNSQCEYFPCHTLKEGEAFNCLFCYCPLYLLGSECGGEFRYTQKGVKDCSACTKPHTPKGYEHVQAYIGKVIEKGKKTQ